MLDNGKIDVNKANKYEVKNIIRWFENNKIYDNLTRIYLNKATIYRIIFIIACEKVNLDIIK